MARFNKALAQLMQKEGPDSPLEQGGTDPSRGVVAELRRRSSTEEYDLASPFFDAFLVNARLLEPKLGTGDIAALTLGGFRFLCERHTSPFALRVYAPSMAEHGWSSPDLAVDIATDDQPSLIESICDAIDGLGAGIEAIIGTVVGVQRNDTGLVKKLRPSRGSGGAGSFADQELAQERSDFLDSQDEPGEALVHLQVSGCANPRDLEAVLRSHLDLIVRGRRDAHVLREQVLELSRRLRAGGDDGRDGETADLLEWLDAGRMAFAGYQEEGPATAPGARSMGVYLNPPKGFSDAWIGADDSPPVSIVKTRVPDPLRPRELLDEIRIRPAQRSDTAPTAYRIAGALSERAGNEPSSAIPVARRAFAAVMTEIDNGPTVNSRAATQIFDSLPLDLILGTATRDLAGVVRAIDRAESEPAFRAHLCPGMTSGFCHLTISVPRQHLSRSDGDRVVDLISQRVARVLAKHLVSDDLAIARLHCILDADADTIAPDLVAEVTGQIKQILSSWRARPMAEMFERVERVDTSDTRSRNTVDPALPSAAAQHLPESSTGPRTPPTRSPPAGGPDRQSIQIVADPASRSHIITAKSRREAGVINRLVAMIDDLGLAIVGHDVDRSDPSLEIHQFRVDAGATVDLESLGELLQAVYAGEVESDCLNSLCRSSDLDARSITVLRCLTALAEHRNIADRTLLHTALATHRKCAGELARLFEVKFDPRLAVAGDGQRKRDLEETLRRYQAAVGMVEPAAQQRILLRLAHLVGLATRTSRYCTGSDAPASPIALKLESGSDDPAPLETFVYAAEFEGFLLRRGRAARASLRIVEDLPSLRRQLLTDLGDQQMRAGSLTTEAGSAAIALKSRRVRPDVVERSVHGFLGAVLDITDSIQGDSVRCDGNVESYDDADPYLSLMIDEEWGSLANIAARTADEREFWMRDAYVTRHDSRVAAEGAWSSIQSLLPAANASEPLRVVAVGKPHQLQLPPSLRLVAAFDDTEVFIDPNGDTKRSSAALQTLAKRETSSWSDFPADSRGSGAGVFTIDSPQVELSEDALQILGTEQQVSTGEQLVQAILRMPADLLWSRQPALLVYAANQAGDATGPAEGRVAIAVSDIGATAIAEPGAGICTPEARVEFALAGGVVHTSAWDDLAADLIADRVSNVDMALALSEGTDAAELSTAELAAEIRRTVMELPARRTFAIGLDRIRSEQNWDAFAICIARRFDSGGDPTHHLASADKLARRLGTHRGLTSPEIITLRSAVAERLQSSVIHTSLAEDRYLDAWIDGYFPSEISARFPGAVDRHPLRHEIAALAVTDRILDVMGTAFVDSLAATRGCEEIDVIKAWCAAFIFGGAQEVFAELETAADALSIEHRQSHRLALGLALRLATSRIIELCSREFGLDKLIDRFGSAAGELLRGWPELLPSPLRADYQAALDRHTGQGLRAPVADHLVRITNLADIVDICDLAIQTNAPRSTVARVFLGLDPILHLHRIGGMIAGTSLQDSRWGTRAAAQLQDRLIQLRRALTGDIIANAGGRKRPLDDYITAHRAALDQLRSLLGEVASSGTTIAGVEVLISHLEHMVQEDRRSWQK